MAAVAILSLAACGSDDDVDPVVTPPADPTFTVSFEDQKLNDNGFWCGTAEGQGQTYDDGYGGTTTTYACKYQEGKLVFPINYSVSSYGSDYWSGFAISNRTAKTFNMQTITPDQYNCVVGKAHSGKNFCVITTYGEELVVNNEKGAIINSLYFTNSAYTANSMENGDSYAHKFTDSDWLTCTIKGLGVDGSSKEVTIELAKGTKYVNTWEKVDLKSLGAVKALTFEFDGSDKGQWGLNTPAYICIDDVNYTLAQ